MKTFLSNLAKALLGDVKEFFSSKSGPLKVRHLQQPAITLELLHA